MTTHIDISEELQELRCGISPVYVQIRNSDSHKRQLLKEAARLLKQQRQQQALLQARQNIR